MVSFDITKAEHLLIAQIVRRAGELSKPLMSRGDFVALRLDMDLTACHANGCPIDLAKLLAADDFNFTHDVFGIHKHLDRQTGLLLGCFLPRCAMPT